MLRVTRLTDYATVVLTALAARPGQVCSAAELAEASGLEPPTVAKVLKPLAQAGLVDGFRGANGGYRLAREASDIALLKRASADRARIITSTIRRPQDNRRMLEFARGVPALIRVFEESDAEWISELGGTPVMASHAAGAEMLKWFDQEFERPGGAGAVGVRPVDDGDCLPHALPRVADRAALGARGDTVGVRPVGSHGGVPDRETGRYRDPRSRPHYGVDGSGRHTREQDGDDFEGAHRPVGASPVGSPGSTAGAGGSAGTWVCGAA